MIDFLSYLLKYFNIKCDVVTDINGVVWGKLVSIQAKEDIDTYDTTACVNLVNYSDDFELINEVIKKYEN